MTIAYLNGDYLPLEQASISPMDRGFLFGDGIYEVIPSYGGRFVGFDRHFDRLTAGLSAISLKSPFSAEALKSLLEELINTNATLDKSGGLGLYLQITRGTAPKRNHQFPNSITPTVFAFTFDIPAPIDGNVDKAHAFSVVTGRDLRWQRCNIKSVSLLGNVLHMMEGVTEGAEEILLFNERDELTEASTSNVFIVRDGSITTPTLDHQKLAGITRNMLVDMLRDHSTLSVIEGSVSRADLSSADEVWLTSSTKEISPVVQIDGELVGAGRPGPVWSEAQTLFDRYRFDY